MQDADPFVEAFATDLDEALGWTLEPGRHHPSLGMPDAAEAFPIAGVTPNRPVLHDVTNAQSFDQRRFHSPMPSFSRMSILLAGILDVRVLVELDVVEQAVHLCDAPDINGLHDVARFGIDRDRAARAHELHALQR